MEVAVGTLRFTRRQDWRVVASRQPMIMLRGTMSPDVYRRHISCTALKIALEPPRVAFGTPDARSDERWQLTVVQGDSNEGGCRARCVRARKLRSR